MAFDAGTGTPRCATETFVDARGSNEIRAPTLVPIVKLILVAALFGALAGTIVGLRPQAHGTSGTLTFCGERMSARVTSALRSFPEHRTR